MGEKEEGKKVEKIEVGWSGDKVNSILDLILI